MCDKVDFLRGVMTHYPEITNISVNDKRESVMISHEGTPNYSIIGEVTDKLINYFDFDKESLMLFVVVDESLVRKTKESYIAWQ